MIASAVQCTIERRLLVNYRIDPERVAPLLPRPFRPQIVSGFAVGGVCFLRLGHLRPAHVPGAIGMTTENVAHRFAVAWDDGGGTHVGVLVPRRDTSSRLTAIGGGKLFPGSYRRARFEVDEPGDDVRIDVASRDGQVELGVAARPAEALSSELFSSMDVAIDFFRNGSLGFSPSRSGRLDAVRLLSASWAARPMAIERMRSSLFDDQTLFPPGACTLDSAMVIRDLPVRWVTDRSPTPTVRAA